MRAVLLLSALAVATLSAAPPARGAAPSIVLQRLQGLVEYSDSADATPVAITGSQQIAIDQYAITGAQSMGALKMADSSVISIGETTKVRAGDLQFAVENGSIHFLVKHAKGAKSNYTFVTPTAQIAVRGTEGMIESTAEYDSVAVVDGAADDVMVTMADGRTMYVPPQKTMRMRKMPTGRVRMVMMNGMRSPGFRQFAKIVAANARERNKAKGKGQKEKPAKERPAKEKENKK
jgi:hypothetical protein